LGPAEGCPEPDRRPGRLAAAREDGGQVDGILAILGNERRDDFQELDHPVQRGVALGLQGADDDVLAALLAAASSSSMRNVFPTPEA